MLTVDLILADRLAAEEEDRKRLEREATARAEGAASNFLSLVTPDNILAQTQLTQNEIGLLALQKGFNDIQAAGNPMSADTYREYLYEYGDPGHLSGTLQTAQQQGILNDPAFAQRTADRFSALTDIARQARSAPQLPKEDYWNLIAAAEQPKPQPTPVMPPNIAHAIEATAPLKAAAESQLALAERTREAVDVQDRLRGLQQEAYQTPTGPTMGPAPIDTPERAQFRQQLEQQNVGVSLAQQFDPVLQAMPKEYPASARAVVTLAAAAPMIPEIAAFFGVQYAVGKAFPPVTKAITYPVKKITEGLTRELEPLHQLTLALASPGLTTGEKRAILKSFTQTRTLGWLTSEKGKARLQDTELLTPQTKLEAVLSTLNSVGITEAAAIIDPVNLAFVLGYPKAVEFVASAKQIAATTRIPTIKQMATRLADAVTAARGGILAPEEAAQALGREGAVPPEGTAPLKVRAIPQEQAPPMPGTPAARAGSQAAANAEAAGPFVGKLYRLVDTALSTYTGRVVPEIAGKLSVGAGGIQAARTGATPANIFERLGKAEGGLKGTTKRGFTFNEEFSTQEVTEALTKAFTNPRLTPFDAKNLATSLEEMIMKREVPTNLASLKQLGKVWPELQPLIQNIKPAHLNLIREFFDAANLPRAVAASFDLSFPLRQGAIFIGRKQWYQSFDDMVKAGLSLGPEYADAHFEKIVNDPLYDLIVNKGGLQIADPGTGVAERLGVAAPRQEMFSSVGQGGTHVAEWTARAPGIKQSQWAYTTGGNDLRWNLAKDKILEWQNPENPVKFTLNDVKALTSWTNIASGWGVLPKSIDKNLGILGTVLFAPRFWASRLEAYPMGLYYLVRNPVLRRQIAYDLVSFTATNVGLLAAAKYIGGATIELDPRSTDFARARFGNTRVDMWAGMQPNVRAIVQMATGKGKSTETGELYPVDLGMQVLRVLQAHLAPGAGLAVDIKQGVTYTGEEVDPTSPKFLKQLGARFAPFWTRDLKDAVKNSGWKAAITAPLSFFGGSVLSYQSVFGKLEQQRGFVAEERTAAGLIKDANGNPLPKMSLDDLRKALGTRAANDALADDPRVVAADQAVEDRKAWYGNTNTSLKSMLARFTAAQLKADTDPKFADPVAWKNDHSDRQKLKAGAVAEHYFLLPEQRDRMQKERAAIGDPFQIPPNAKPDDIVARYLAIFTDHTNDIGERDDALYDELDRFQAILSPQQASWLDTNLGLKATPREKKYYAGLKQVEDYFDINEQVYQQNKDDLHLTAPTYLDYQKQIQEAGTKQAILDGKSPEDAAAYAKTKPAILAVAPEDIYLESQIAATKKRWRLDNPTKAQLLITLGLDTPSAADYWQYQSAQPPTPSSGGTVPILTLPSMPTGRSPLTLPGQ